VRNLTGGIKDDPRRVYCLSVRREEPSVTLVALASGNSPTGVNVQRGGHTVVDVLALRKRGMNASLKITAQNLPPGLSVADAWIGPGSDSVPLVVSASEDCQEMVTSLDLIGIAGGKTWPVQFGTMIRAGVPGGSGRVAASLPVMVTGHAPLRLMANGHEPLSHQLYGALQVRHSPGGILDVAVTVDRTADALRAAVSLSAIGLPDAVRHQVATMEPEDEKGYISFFLPHSLPLGTYSIVIRGDTRTSAGDVVVYSEPVTFEVTAPMFRVDVQPTAPRSIGRGKIVQIPYTARRLNGFIGKIHTELAIPGTVTEVGRLRARGVTFVGETGSGTIQIIANDDAKLGRIPFLRLYAVGVVEDVPMYHGCCFLDLETVE
jgi:hypothetical protein